MAERFAAGRTLGSIADEAGCTVSAVRNAADRLELDRRRAVQYQQLRDRTWLRRHYIHAGIRPRRSVSTLDDDAIRSAYLNEQLSAPKIARRLGIHSNTVYRALDRAGVVRRDRRRGTNRRLGEPGWLATRLADGDPISTIAADANCSPHMVRAAIDRLELPRPHRPTHTALRDRAWVERRYLAEQRTIAEIADELGASRDVRAALIRHRIPRGTRRRRGWR